MSKNRIYIALLAIISFLVYSNTLKNSFVWDDFELIKMVENPVYKKYLADPFFFLKPSYWKEYSTLHDVQSYVPFSPVRIYSIYIDYRLFKYNPFGYHLTNNILNIIAVILVYFLFVELFKKFDVDEGKLRLYSFFSTLVFSTHPMHTETVNWIKNRLEIMSFIGIIASLLFFVRFIENKRRAFYILSFLSFMFALISKELGFVVPFCLSLYILCFYKNKKLQIYTSAFWFFDLLYLYLIQFKLKSDFFLAPIGARLDIYTNILTVFKTIAYYIKLLILPFSFNIERYFVPPKFLIEPSVLVSVLTVIFLGALTYFMFKKESRVSFAFLWFFVTIAPVSNIIYLAPRPIGEHRLYLPSVSLAFLVGISMIYFSKYIKQIIIFVSLLSIAFGILSFKRNYDWKDDFTIFSRTAEVSPNNPRVWYNLGFAHLIRGELEKAKECFEKSISIAPNFYIAYRGLGFYYFRKGDIENAIKSFRNSGDVN